MASRTIKLQTICYTFGFILTAEVSAWLTVRFLDTQPFLTIGLVRMVQIAGVIIGIYLIQKDLSAIGLSLTTWRRGVLHGIYWSLGFGAFVVISMGIIHLMNHNPINLVRSPLPSDTCQLVTFFIVGALISPIAEEICFRGVLFSYFRRWGVAPAVLISTIIFTVLHSFQGFPTVQLVGAVLFAASFEFSKSLLTPIVIHILGNLAIFTLSSF